MNFVKKKNDKFRLTNVFNKYENFKKQKTKKVGGAPPCITNNRGIFSKKNIKNGKLTFYHQVAPAKFLQQTTETKKGKPQKNKPFFPEKRFKIKKTFSYSKPISFFKPNAINDIEAKKTLKLKPAYFKEANVTFEQFKKTLKLKIISILSVGQISSKTFSQIRKGTTIEVDVTDFKLIFKDHFIPKSVLAKVKNNPNFDGCVNAIFIRK